MCEPVSIGLAIMGAASAAMAHQSSVAEADAANDAAARTHDSARLATQIKYDQEGRKLVEDNRANNQAGFDVQLEKTAAMSTALTMAGASGIQGYSPESVIAMEAQKGARNAGRIDDRKENSYMDFLAGVNAAEVMGQQQINANPFTAGPSAASGVMSTIMGGTKGYAMGGGFDGLSIPGGGETATSLGKQNMITNSQAGWYSPVG